MVESYWTSDNGETTPVVHQGHVLDVLREMPAESRRQPYFVFWQVGIAVPGWREHG